MNQQDIIHRQRSIVFPNAVLFCRNLFSSRTQYNRTQRIAMLVAPVGEMFIAILGLIDSISSLLPPHAKHDLVTGIYFSLLWIAFAGCGMFLAMRANASSS